LNRLTCDIILETFVNLSHNAISESLQNEMRTLGGFDTIIDASKHLFLFLNCCDNFVL